MTRLVLNKNPEQNSAEITFDIKKIIEQNTINSIMCSDPFSKNIILYKNNFVDKHTSNLSRF